jgi:hypothetical protein
VIGLLMVFKRFVTFIECFCLLKVLLFFFKSNKIFCVLS